MRNVFISTMPNPPIGFEYRSPSRRDILGSRIVLLSDSLDESLNLTDSFSEKVCGVVITEGKSFFHSRIGPLLWHLTVQSFQMANLKEIVSFFLDTLSLGQTAIDENANLKIELSLSRKLQKQTQFSYNQTTERLSAKVSEISHVFDFSQFGIFRTDLEGKIFLANPALTKIFGYDSLEEMNRVGLQNIYQHKSERKRLLSMVTKGPVKEFVTSFIKANGTIIDIQLTMYPVFSENGTLIFFEGNLIDITDKRKTLKEIHDLRNYLTNIIDSMPSILIGLDKNISVTLWNKPAEKITGISAKMAKGKLLKDVFPDVLAKMDRIIESINTGKTFHEQRKASFSAAGIHYEDITIFPITGQLVQSAVIRIDDVTKECELEEQLNHSRKMDAIGQLAGGIAHDFNNMLAAIIGATELLESHDGVISKEESTYIEMILKASTRAANLTAKLLAFGRKGVLTSTNLDLHEIIDDTVSILKSSLDKIVNINVAKKAEASIISGDASALHNAFVNIGINASNAMPDGGNIFITTSNIKLDSVYCENSIFDVKPGLFVQVEVRDTGYGIPKENLRKIFEPFFTTSKLGTGSGLGLPAVYGTVQDHQGVICVYSEVGTGTSFKILLPCSVQEFKDYDKDVNTVTGSGKILLVDDEELIRVIGKLLLEEMGYSVLLADNGRTAVDLFKTKYKEIDLVIMDMIMPEMNGQTAFFKMKEIQDSCKVIISSGFSKAIDIDTLTKEGLAGFISKPFKASELSLLIDKVLRQGNCIF